MPYDPARSEPRWQQAWHSAGTFQAVRDDRPKYYVLEMFPYPSGRIHMGHVRNYTMGDVVARYKRAQGFSVLHPMGWDAFGMPAENAAMEQGGHPRDWTYANIATMRDQLKPLGLSIDWSREFATCDDDYVAQQQALFVDMLDAGLIYRKAAVVNWDPVDMTVLANEQVIDGKGWRSGAQVERRELTQWFFRISDYADELLGALDGLDGWPDKVRLMQANWIGKSRGLQMRFDTVNAPAGFDAVEVYTTRPDTLLGASFLAISADHPLARALEADDPRLAEFAAAAPHDRHHRRGAGKGRKAGRRHRHPRAPPAGTVMGTAGLDRQLRADGLWHRRDLRLSRSRPARPRLCAQVRSADPRDVRRAGHDGGSGRRAGRGCALRAGEIRAGDLCAQLHRRGRPDRGRRRRRRHRARRGERLWPRRDQVPAARLGHLAPALLGLPDPDRALRCLRHGARGARQPARAAAAGCQL